MRNFAIAGAVLMLFATSASAGDLSVASSTLENMGLGGMQQMSDADGQTVRGKGTLDGFLVPALGAIDASINEGLVAAGAGGLFPNGLHVGDMILGELPDLDLPGFGGFPGGGFPGGGFPGGGFPGGGFPGGGFGGGLGGGFGMLGF